MPIAHGGTRTWCLKVATRRCCRGQRNSTNIAWRRTAGTVVQTAGFKEGSWLDNNGHPHTEALRTTERFRRVNFGHMEVDITIDDPKAYSRPWKSDTMRFTLQPDTELLEHLCENNRDLPILERYWRGQEQAGQATKGKQ